MHTKSNASHTANLSGDGLVFTELLNGQAAWLRPELPALCPPRSAWPTFVIQTETVYQVAAPTAERALRWFADDEDTELHIETVDFGTVQVLGHVAADEPDDVRYVLTSRGRAAIHAKACDEQS